MKKIAAMFLVCFYLFTGAGYAQVKNIPASVTTTFKIKYPLAGHVSWITDGKGYAARFFTNGEPCTVRFTNNGDWLDETKKISFGDLRSNVKNAFSQSKFASWQAYEVNEIQEKNKEKQYRILIRNREEKGRYIYFDMKGQLMKEVLTM